ncbi:hypothetical protein TELCIR_07223 [Teladorsagia circumcincta]|uniref:SLC12A transporter C-terminal domain-containing protein n=1 Tax=Teladorsagia circumcincta TaxID=45464 RepID=A0A2G9UKV0_TELCI|nr:hypothetical protein TELCIR_07223 [Teladorsagia circumcincta]
MQLCVDRKWNWPHVFVRCLQNMLGVIIFIRITWITDEVGLVFCLLVLLAAAIRSVDYFQCRLVMMLLVLIAVLMQMVGLLLPSLIMERRINSTAFNISDYNPYDEKAMGFVVYFPAVTCIFAGLTIRGNFKRKKAVLKSLPVTVVVLLSCFYCAYTAFLSAAQSVQLLYHIHHNPEQDVGKSSGLVPGWDKMGKGYGKENSPRVAFVVITLVGIALTMIAEKPMYRWFNRWLALLCSLLCVHIMLAVSWKLTNAAILTFLKFYIYIKWKQSQIKSGQKLAGSSFTNTLSGLQNMERESDLSYKPQMMLLTGNPAARPALVDFANNIIMGRSLLICGFVIPQPVSSRTYIMTEKVDRQMSEWLANRDVSAFPATVANENQVEGAATLLQTSGVGKMRPNILMVGFKTKWERGGASNLDAVIGYYEIVLNAFEKNVGVAIFRNSHIGFDLTERLKHNDSGSVIDADENGINTDP